MLVSVAAAVVITLKVVKKRSKRNATNIPSASRPEPPENNSRLQNVERELHLRPTNLHTIELTPVYRNVNMSGRRNIGVIESEGHYEPMNIQRQNYDEAVRV